MGFGSVGLKSGLMGASYRRNVYVRSADPNVEPSVASAKLGTSLAIHLTPLPHANQSCNPRDSSQSTIQATSGRTVSITREVMDGRTLSPLTSTKIETDFSHRLE
jgi:hypothetical protein